MYIAHPGGASSIRSIQHYSQNYLEDRFQVWAPKYDALFKPQKVTDLIPINEITVPTALFVGENDLLADATDAMWIKEVMGDTVFHYQLNAGGHSTFLYGKDMTYWNDIMDIFAKYQPLPGAAEFLQ